MFRELIGTLFIGYAGWPQWPAFSQPTKTCTDVNCVCRSALQVQFHYVFPSWFMKRIITMRAIVLRPSGINISLATRGLIPSAGAKVYHFMLDEDLDGLKELFSSRLASPNDSMYDDGKPILYVSCL